MSLLLSSCRPFLRSLPRSLYLPPVIRIPHSLSARSFQTPTAASPPKFAFAFDIDGVLMHGSNPTKNATTALSLLSKNAIEFILITNGGGKSETARTAELSERLNFPINPEQLIQSHTPLAALASKPELKTILVVGGEADNCRHVAKEYGFQNVILPCDILAAYPSLSPFSVNKTPNYAQPLPEGEIKFDAIMVFNDPRDWALDIQLIIDLLLSDEGRLGTRRSSKCTRPHIPLYFSNPDLLWVNEYHLPRLAQAGFRAALAGSWKALERISKWNSLPVLRYWTFGKPNPTTYEYAESLLFDWRKTQLLKAGVAEPCEDVKTIYMIGDNPRSDILGANNFRSPRGVNWVSVLVMSGVYRDGDDTLRANTVVGDVLDAVNWAIAREEKLLRGKRLDDEPMKVSEEESEEGSEEGSEEENQKVEKDSKKAKMKAHLKKPKKVIRD